MRQRLPANKRNVRSGVRAALIVTGIMPVLMLLLAPVFISLDGLASVIEVSKFGFTVWRLLMFLLLISGWPAFTTIYANWAGLTAQQTANLKAYRWRMAGWLLVMEVLFCQTLWLDIVQMLIEIGR